MHTATFIWTAEQQERVDQSNNSEWKDKEITIEFSFTPATPDVFYLRNGDPGYPGDPAEITDWKAVVSPSCPIELVEIFHAACQRDSSLEDALIDFLLEEAEKIEATGPEPTDY